MCTCSLEVWGCADVLFLMCLLKADRTCQNSLMLLSVLRSSDACTTPPPTHADAVCPDKHMCRHTLDHFLRLSVLTACPCLQVYAWCLHEALLQTLALPQRALTLPDSAAEPAPLLAALPGFLQAACSGLHQLLVDSPPSPSSPKPEAYPAGHDLASCADLLDGRIMHLLVHSLSAQQALGLPEQVTQAASGLLAAVFSLAGTHVPSSDPLLEAAEQCAAGPVPEAEALGSGSHPEGGANGQAGLPDPVMGHGLVQAFLGSRDSKATDDDDDDRTT